MVRVTAHRAFLYAGGRLAAQQCRRCFLIANGKREHEINGQIRDREVRVIGNDGSQLGVMQTRDALRMAEESDLDLVKIAPQANPPVVKILDYGKFRFEQQKKEKEARKNQKVVEIKEIRLSLKIDIGDFNTKLSHARKFLEKGDKLKVSIRFRGREMAHARMGLDVHRRFAEQLEDLATVENPPKLEGRQMIMTMAPLKEDAKKEKAKKAEAAAKADAKKAEPKAPAKKPEGEKAQPKAKAEAKAEPKATKEEATKE